MGCWPIAKMLEDPLCHLESLNLASNEIRSRGAAAIFKAVDTNKTLTSLSLRSNLIDSDAVSALQVSLLSCSKTDAGSHSVQSDTAVNRSRKQ